MKVSSLAIVFSVMVGGAHAFTVIPAKQQAPSLTTAPLQYTIVQGIEPDEQDHEARELVQEMMSHRKREHGDDQYAGYDATLSEADAINRHLNVDSFSNSIAGGIIPGFQLTSLCADD